MNTCQICGVKQEEISSKLFVHHINYDKENNMESNLISFCKKCHAQTNNNRYFWNGLLFDLGFHSLMESSIKIKPCFLRHDIENLKQKEVL